MTDYYTNSGWQASVTVGDRPATFEQAKKWGPLLGCKVEEEVDEGVFLVALTEADADDLEENGYLERLHCDGRLEVETP